MWPRLQVTLDWCERVGVSSFDFDRSTQVVRREDRDLGTSASTPVTFDAMVHDGWDIMGNANGGYVLALVARALSAVTGRPDCITVTCHYLAPCPAGPAVIDVVLVRAGKRFATATATLWRDIDGARKVIAQVMATMGDLTTDPGGPTSMSAGAPSIPSYDECEGFHDAQAGDIEDNGKSGDGESDSGESSSDESVQGGTPQLHKRLGTRFHPDDLGYRGGTRTGRGLIRGWFAFRDGRPIDSLALLLASDAFPPAVFNLDVATNWVPTVELTVHVRAIPAPGPVQCSFETRYLQNGLLDEDGEIWDSNGVLVAQSRQLALAPRS